MSNSPEFRAASWEVESAEKITGYAVVFERRTVLYKDPITGKEYGEIISRHALDKANMDDVVLRFNHQGHVLARTRNKSLTLTIDDHGLKIVADMTGSDLAREHYQEVKSGLIDKMSFAFVIKRESWDSTTNTRRIEEIETLQDVSLVDFPAYNQTEVSARNKFESLAEPDRVAYRKAQVNGIRTDMELRISQYGITGTAADYCTRSQYEAAAADWDRTQKSIPAAMRKRSRPDPVEPILHDLLEMYDQTHNAEASDDLPAALEARERLDALENEYRAAIQRKQELRSRIAAGYAGTTVETFGTNNRKDNSNMTTENREFFNKFIEARAAGTTATLTQLIPSTIMDQYVIEEAPGAFYAAASVTNIDHAGNLTIPVATLQTISQHVENAEITDAGYVPGSVVIQHAEYCYKTGYSDLAVQIGAESLERIVKDTCIKSMLKKMDGLCIGAVAALTYTDNTNAVKVTTAPSFSDFVTLAAMLGADYLGAAKWRMSPATYFTWLLGLKDDNNRPILDPSKLVSEQALGGYGIELDSQLPASVVYFGDGSRVHLNYARSPELNSWTDHDHNTQKISVRTVAGATAETGCMVKMYAGV